MPARTIVDFPNLSLHVDPRQGGEPAIRDLHHQRQKAARYEQKVTGEQETDKKKGRKFCPLKYNTYFCKIIRERK